MLTQHLFLSLAVAALLLAPRALFALFGVGRPEAASAKKVTLPSSA